MARKHRRRNDEHREVSSVFSNQVIESQPDGDWYVRRISGSGSTKTYRCPGCDHEITPATPHVVVWSADDPKGAEVRRHWHTPCWQQRSRRGRV